MSPRATVRLQFHRGFTLDDAAATVPYYAALGISHIYASPLLSARSGSTHGYDTTDCTRINPELGGVDALRRLVAVLRRHDMGLVLDIVPNHMGVSLENRWWFDLLEWGRESPHADWFDIDWDDPDPRLRGRVMLPTLGTGLEAMVERGEVGLVLEPDDGRLYFELAGQCFPLAARDYAAVLATDSTLAALAQAVAGDRAGDDATVPRQAFERLRQSLRERVASADGHQALAATLAGFGTETAAGRERLQHLLHAQHYHLAPWRQAWERINWRRFFDINELVSLRAEREDVFEASHELVLSLYAEGSIDGLRIDHIDGLADPGAYCRRLRARMQALDPQRPAGSGDGGWLVVEKILAPDEHLRTDWACDGSTGYEFMDQVGALLHDPAGVGPLEHGWRELAGEEADFAQMVAGARRQMIGNNFVADRERCVRALQALAEAEGAALDAGALRGALVELLVAFPRYRTYAQPGACEAEDRAVLEASASQAEREGKDFDPAAMQALLRWIGGAPPAGAAAADVRDALDRFQQLSPPLAAKALEDTSFYRYARLISRNEVGADPERLALTAEAFHQACARRARDFPHSLLATATHDHKRGEDVRARLAVLSEMPRQWIDELRDWRGLNSRLRPQVAGKAVPDAIDESMLYQTLLGALPLDTPPDGAPLDSDFIARVSAWQTKALREAKRHSSWIDQDADYEAGCSAFLERLGRDDAAAGFRRRLAALGGRIAAAGAVNGLVQALLRLTTPGVPDLYQGCDFWDLSLVDPDNRRPVDHPLRRQALEDATTLDTLLAGWRDGRIKQRLIHAALQLRSRQPALFSEGGYRRLAVRGARAGHVLAFAREHQGHCCVVVVGLHVLGLATGDGPRVEPAAWRDTEVELPLEGNTEWMDALGGRAVPASGGHLALAEAMDQLPCLLLSPFPAQRGSRPGDD